MSALSNQMQAKMTARLDELRNRVIGQMTSAGERIKKRPSLPGDNALKTVSNHDVMKQDDSGFQLLSAGIGIPGVSEIVGTMIDVGIDMAADRKATRMRPQDNVILSPKQARQVREKNAEDLKLFESLSEKLNFLDAAIASGDILAVKMPDSDSLLTLNEEEALKQGISIPKPKTDSDHQTLKPSDAFIAYHASRQALKTTGPQQIH